MTVRHWPFVIVCAVIFGSLLLWSQESRSDQPLSTEQLQYQLRSANAQISRLEERIKLMTLQQQGAVQFFQAGQALCELDKKQAETIQTPDTK